MTSDGKTQDQAAREAPVYALLERLKPGGAATVLRRLLEWYPHLSSEAEKITRSLLIEQMDEEVTYYNFGPFCLDAGRRILRKEGKKVDLDATPMEVLLALVESEETSLAQRICARRPGTADLLWTTTLISRLVS